MFTGLVREVAKVASFEGGRLVVETGLQAELGALGLDRRRLLDRRREGRRELAFDVVPETRDRVKPFGAQVNLEPALRAGEPLGGHYVQGHVDGVGRIVSVAPEAGGVRVRVEPRPSCSAISSRRDRWRSGTSR